MEILTRGWKSCHVPQLQPCGAWAASVPSVPTETSGKVERWCSVPDLCTKRKPNWVPVLQVTNAHAAPRFDCRHQTATDCAQHHYLKHHLLPTGCAHRQQEKSSWLLMHPVSEPTTTWVSSMRGDRIHKQGSKGQLGGKVTLCTGTVWWNRNAKSSKEEA